LKKRLRYNKPILRRLQVPPAVSDQNYNNVFRPREKVHRRVSPAPLGSVFLGCVSLTHIHALLLSQAADPAEA